MENKTINTEVVEVAKELTEKEKFENKLKEGIYIPSIEARLLYTYNEKNEAKDYIVDEKYLNKLLKGKLDWSYELLKNTNLINIIENEDGTITTTGIEIKELDGKLYTFDVVNVKYTEKYKDLKNKNGQTKKANEKGTKALRDWTYVEGFKFNSKGMTNWKRSGGKARQGQNLFLRADLVDKCLAWARMNLDFESEKEVDIAGIRAYESLPLSSIVTTLEIDVNKMLIVDDFESVFPWTMSVTTLDKDGKLQTENKTINEKNSIWDGLSLIDHRLLLGNEILHNKSCALLRNRLTKSCAFSCKLEKFYRNHCRKKGLDYETYKINDMYGNEFFVKDIQLISTPSSFKISKYNDMILKLDKYKNLKNEKGAWLQYWKDNADKEFGVCKHEKPSHLCEYTKDEDGKLNIEYINTLSYQILNTMVLEKEDVKELLKPSIAHINKLKTDDNYFLETVLKDAKENEEEMKRLEETINDDDILEFAEEEEDIIDKATAFVTMTRTNRDLMATDVFKKYRSNYINAKITELQKGRVPVSNTDYAVACGNPIELLNFTVGTIPSKENSTLKDTEIFCSRFKNGEEIGAFRNPHTSEKNCNAMINKEVKEIKEYMVYSDNVFYMNSIEYPNLTIFSGEDFDVDCNLLSNNKTIVKGCKGAVARESLIPKNGVIPSSKGGKKPMTQENMANIDHIIAKNLIGEDINFSQELNSLYFHMIHNGSTDTEKIKNIYKYTSRATSISNVEIDKAKKIFENLNVTKELSEMKKICPKVNSTEDIDKEIEKLQQDIKDTKDRFKEERKADSNKLRTLKAKLTRNENKENSTLEDDEVATIKAEIAILEEKVSNVKLKEKIKIQEIKTEINKLKRQKSATDTRRIKPYFFKFIGDTNAQRQRRATNEKHRWELDKPIIEAYLNKKNDTLQGKKKDEIKKIKKQSDVKKLLDVNNSIQKAWEEAQYTKDLDCPMNWLVLALQDKKDDTTKIVRSKGKTQIHTIDLIKEVKKAGTPTKIKNVVDAINKLSNSIKETNLKKDLTAKQKHETIQDAKDKTIKLIKDEKLDKASMYKVLKECLNTPVKERQKNNKFKVTSVITSGVESLTLELFFKIYGTKFLGMFKEQKDEETK